MKRRIADFADITIGYQHRGEPVTAASVGSHLLIQIKDVDREGRFVEQFEVPAEHRLWLGSLYMVTPTGPADAYAVREGDVLFLSRGNRYFAVPMVRPYVEPFPPSWDSIIAAYYFYILRLRREDVLPEYLAWSLNSELMQAEMHRGSEGTHMTMIKRRDFENLTVPIPPLETQRRIVELHHLALRERRLMEQIQSKRTAMVETLCSQIAAGRIQ